MRIILFLILLISCGARDIRDERRFTAIINTLTDNAFLTYFKSDLAYMSGIDSILDSFADATGIYAAGSSNYTTREGYVSANTATQHIRQVQHWENYFHTGYSYSYKLGDLGGAEHRVATKLVISETQFITGVKLRVSISDPPSGTPTGVIYPRIETDNAGNPSGTLFSAGSIGNFDPTTAVYDPALSAYYGGGHLVSFASTVSLTPGTYWLVLQCPLQSTGDHWYIPGTKSEVWGIGKTWERYSEDGGGTWTTPANNTYGRIYFEFQNTGAVGDMALVSAYTEADYEATAVRALLLIRPLEAITWNTDIKFWVSNNNGTDWDQIMMSPKAVKYDANTYMLTAQGYLTDRSDTAMRYLITTHNTKKIDIVGVALGWTH